MKSLSLPGLVLAGLIAAVTSSAQATILTFDIKNQANYNPITTYGTRVNSLTDVDGSYLQGNGFTPNVVTSYRTINPNTQAAISSQLDSWATNYGDLINVAFASNSGGMGEITLTPDAGYGVTLNSFDLAGWFNDYTDQPLVIYDAAYNVLVSYSPVTAPGASQTSHASFSPSVSSNGAIHIQFGNNWNVGIDNVNFDQFRNANAVPEPATIASASLAAVAGLAFARRRRSA